jgi:hypothetical protein
VFPFLFATVLSDPKTNLEILFRLTEIVTEEVLSTHTHTHTHTYIYMLISEAALFIHVGFLFKFSQSISLSTVWIHCFGIWNHGSL